VTLVSCIVGGMQHRAGGAIRPFIQFMRAARRRQEPFYFEKNIQYP
jgi:hypothetical protein